MICSSSGGEFEPQQPTPYMCCQHIWRIHTRVTNWWMKHSPVLTEHVPVHRQDKHLQRFGVCISSHTYLATSDNKKARIVTRAVSDMNSRKIQESAKPSVKIDLTSIWLAHRLVSKSKHQCLIGMALLVVNSFFTRAIIVVLDVGISMRVLQSDGFGM